MSLATDDPAQRTEIVRILAYPPGLGGGAGTLPPSPQPEGAVMRDEVTTRRIEIDGLVGVLGTPSRSTGSPGVLLVGGSEGGLHERDAVAMASEGFTALSLAYFGAPGLPPGLVDIPLEYFFRALDVLEEHTGPGRPIGVVGGSRGSEAALLIAAHDPRVGAAVSVVGSGLVTQGIDFRRGTLLDILATPTNAWTLRGEPLPYLPNVVHDDLRDLVQRGLPVPLGLAFPPVPDDPVVLERVRIPVEAIAGPLLVLTAGDDRMWPSTAYSAVAITELRARGRTVEHRSFPEAGHPIAGAPGQPYTSTTAPGPGVTFDMGGTPEANTAARRAAWDATVHFLRDTLGPR